MQNSFFLYKYRPSFVGAPSCVRAFAPNSDELSSSDSSDDDSDDTSKLLIIVVSIIGVALLVLMLSICFMILRRYWKRGSVSLEIEHTHQDLNINISPSDVLHRPEFCEPKATAFKLDELEPDPRDMTILKTGVPVASD
jgi:hypothetical protein